MFKYFSKRIFIAIGSLFSIKPVLFINFIINLIFNQLYSGWVKRQLNVSGKLFFTKKPFYIFNGKNIYIGENFISGRRNRVETFNYYNENSFSPRIEIGNNVLFNDDCHIACINNIKIGNDVLFASKIFITDHFHGEISFKSIKQTPIDRNLTSKGKVDIGDNVWIGEGVCIMPNVSIGRNCIIGANSVVTKSFTEDCVIAGNPAKIISVMNEKAYKEI